MVLDTYKILADESRLRLIRILARGAFNVQELTSILDISQSTVSHHLKLLLSAGIAENKRQGTWGYYSLARARAENEVALQVVHQFLSLPYHSTTLHPIFQRDDQAIESVLTRRRTQSHHYFESVAKQWNELRGEMTPSFDYLEELRRRIPSEVALVELGCGSGALLERILPRSGRTIGVDYSQAMLSEARLALGTRAEAVDLRLGNLEHLPLGDGSVDYAVASMVMHHIATPQEALRDIFRVVKSGGTLLILDLVEHKNEEMRERFADLWLGFNADEFSDWAKEAGFTVVSLELLGTTNEMFLLSAHKP